MRPDVALKRQSLQSSRYKYHQGVEEGMTTTMHSTESKNKEIELSLKKNQMDIRELKGQ